jgi:N-methylhydantoinase A
MAPIAYEAVHSLLMPLDRFDAQAVNAVFARLRREAEQILRLAGPSERFIERRFADMRYRGQGHELNVELPARAYTSADASTFRELFDAQYRKNYSRTIPNLGAEALTWILVLSCPTVSPTADKVRDAPPQAAPIEGRKPIFDAACGAFLTASTIRRERLEQGSYFEGPALIIEDQTTTYVPSGFDGKVSSHGHLVLKRRSPS